MKYHRVSLAVAGYVLVQGFSCGGGLRLRLRFLMGWRGSFLFRVSHAAASCLWVKGFSCGGGLRYCMLLFRFSHAAAGFVWV